MPATEEMTITLPKELADIVRAKVASGEYASESDVFACSLRTEFDDDVLPLIDEGELEQWLRTEGPLLCAEADAHPEDMLTVDDMYRAIDDEIEAIRREQ